MTLISMTGFGDARIEQADHAVTFELRSINSRHLKISLRTTDGYASLDAQVESLLRNSVKRGTIHANLRIRHLGTAEDYRVNTQVLERYIDEIQKVAAKRGLCEELRLEPLGVMPGVVEQLSSEASDPDGVWPLVKKAVTQALDKLNEMRTQEGAALAVDLQSQCESVAESLGVISQRTEVVTDHYRQRLHDRVSEALAKYEVTIEPAELIREVCLFADRSDISEEVVRLRSHLQQFADTLELKESTGRKLEFICQEMGRETNTIGSKANDAQISGQVVEIKTALERIREQIQNVQ